MAIRTTDDEVKAVMAPGKDYDNKSSLAPFIAMANSRVNWLAANATTYGRTVPSAADLRIIESWLSAHFYKQSDQQLQASNAGGSTGAYRGVTGDGLSSTLYGRSAIGADPTGILRAIDEGRVARGVWLGRVPSEQTDYVDRN